MTTSQKKEAPKNVPKRDGSGRGTGQNAGRGGCNPPKRPNQVKE